MSAWNRQTADVVKAAFEGGAGKHGEDHETTIRELRAKVGELTMERDFFSTRFRGMSSAERMAAVHAAEGISIVTRCALAGVSRLSPCYIPAGESKGDQAPMRRMDELHTAYPFYGVRQMCSHPRPTTACTRTSLVRWGLWRPTRRGAPTSRISL